MTTIDAFMALGREHSLSSYDASYLELAIRHGLPLATLDHNYARRHRRSACRAPLMRVSRSASISVIIVGWQVRELLRACLASIAAHEDLSALEVWVVDNASTDGTAAMVAAEFPWVRLVALDREPRLRGGQQCRAPAGDGRCLRPPQPRHGTA